ncbi:MAG: ABC transporter permease [Alphaproteobacteria bacterium]|jgi:iron(III) transport system permease protein
MNLINTLSRLFGRLSLMSLWHHLIFFLVFIGVVIPLVFLVLGSFSMADLPTDFTFDTMGLDNYEEVWWDPSTYKLFYNTAIYVTGSVIFGITLAAMLAWMVERTDIPGKMWIYAGVPMTLAMPGMLQAMAWVLLLSPRIGYLNVFLDDVLGIGRINVYTLGGIIFVEGLRLVPTAFLMLVPLLRSMDPTLEEASFMSGAGPASTLRKVTLRLMAPGMVAVIIYQAMTALEVFEVPGVLGLPGGIYVFSTKIYSIINTQSALPAYGQANALSMFYLVIAVVTTFFYARMISKSERFTIVTGKGYRPRLMELGRWRGLAISLVVAFLVLSVLLPLLVLVYTSLLPYLQEPSWEVLGKLTFRHYVKLSQDPIIGTVLWNTFLLVVISSTVTTVFSFLISMVVVRSKFWGRRLLDQLSFMPHAIPGIVMGVAFIWMFLKIDQWTSINIYGTVWSICIGFILSFIAYGTRAMNAALLQLHKELEEAAYTSGATVWRTMRKVFMPLLMPALAGVWIWVMLHVIRIAGMPLILYQGPENQVLAVLIWNEWDHGHIEIVAAIGTLMLIGLLLITMGLRLFGFGRGTNIQKS